MVSNRLDIAASLFGQAVEQHQLGCLAKALELYGTAIRLNPGLAAAHCNRGLVLQALGKTDDALSSYDRALAVAPRYADAHYNRAISLGLLKRRDEAVQSYDRAIACNPDCVEAYGNRGNVLRDLERPQDALASFDTAIRLRPDFAPTHHNRGNALQDLERWEEAVASYDRAVALKPDFAEAWSNRASALMILGKPEEALRSSAKALELKPDSAEAWVGRGNALKDLLQIRDAIESYDRAIALRPGYADAYWNKAVAVLLTGNFKEGWPLYEWRKHASHAARYPVSKQPEWTGKESLENKTLVIYAEQGLGDTIQFCRYARLAAERGAKVIFVVQRELVRLLEHLGSGIELVAHRADIRNFDYHIALLSLPGAFQTTPFNCPSGTPYLRAETERVAKWRNRFGAHGFKIGICWQGNRKGVVDAGRSVPVRHFARFAQIPGVRLICLQKGESLAQLRDPSPGAVEIPGEDFDAGPDAFLDTVAIMENLDLIVTSDTAVAHLAGALGRPVWLALKQVPDWRWLLDGKDTFWYPTMRLFRQRERGNWASAFAEIEAHLVQQVNTTPAGA